MKYMKINGSSGKLDYDLLSSKWNELFFVCVLFLMFKIF